MEDGIKVSLSGVFRDYRPDFDPADSCNRGKYQLSNFHVDVLPLNCRPYRNILDTLTLTPLRDAQGVRLIEMRGDTIYHPISIAQYGLGLIDFFGRSNDSLSLTLAKSQAAHLLSTAITVDTSLLFPLEFKYFFYEVDHMSPPWYSAMAQGQILSLLCRLYEFTGERKYRIAARKTFNSMLRFKRDHEIWFSCVDKEGFLWFEEYPNELPSHVYNGMIFATFGVYDYYALTKDQRALELFKSALLTIKHNFEFIRKRGDVSYYCLKYPSQISYYQSIHIDQFNYLFDLTGDVFFSSMADSLMLDHTYNKTPI